MRTFRLNKLVRDKIVTDMQAMGQHVASRTLDDVEYRQRLLEKLVEEVRECRASDEGDMLKELADLIEVIDATASAYGIDHDQLKKIQAERREKRGSFDGRIYIEDITLEDDDPWVDYYVKEPNRFPEIKE